MPPIKVHIDAPITPKKGLATSSQNSPYPAAQPGAPAVPAPTGYVPSPQAVPQPTRTTATSNYGPPPPQPGAFPIPPSQSSPLPPPPKAGETPQRQPSVTTMPPQMSIPPPQQNYTPTRGTMYNSPAQGTPSTINFGAVPVPAPIQAGSHPPGYQQNLNAQEMSSAARASMDMTERKESMSMGGGLGLGGGDAAEDTVGNAWNVVKGWANAAGKTLAETEKEVWKRISKE